MSNVQILVVGGASLDTLAGANERVAGGAGMYTAMAAYRGGAEVTLCAPLPVPMPAPLQAVADSVHWIGPAIDVDDLAHFKIKYHDGLTTYETSKFGAEAALTAADLPDDLSNFDCVHLIPLGNIKQQYEMALACRQRGAKRISMGTALHLIDKQPEAATDSTSLADLFFMNAEEAERLFGSIDAVHGRADQVLFVTLGADGAIVAQGETHSKVSGVAADVLDPTGAGDTFCGATLTQLACGAHPLMAVRAAMPAAAGVTEAVGGSALLDEFAAHDVALDQRVIVDDAQVASIASQVAADSHVVPFDFVGPDLPEVGHPFALHYFFASTLQQFSFWSIQDGHYERPLIATLDGEERKGAFYFFRAYKRWLENDPEMLSPSRQASLSKDELLSVLRADDGSDPMPAVELHLSLAHQYGRDMLALNFTPELLVQRANEAQSTTANFFAALDQIGGYKEDPLRKKTALLAIILQQRPEAFLRATEDMPPVVDYHIMRSCLRTGLIDVQDKKLYAKLTARQLLNEDEEWAVRSAAYRAIERVASQSGKSMGAVDWFFFQARKRCPEMTQPVCSECPIDPVCAHRKDLFQPVRRTSFY